MTRIFIYFTIALLYITTCISCGAQEPTTNETVEKTVASQKVDANKAPNKYKDGKKDGLWKSFYNNGHIKQEGNFSEGKKEGLHKEWFESGVLSLEGFYKNGKANGLMKWYHEKGHLAAQGNMIDDKRNGAWKICDIENASLCIDANFVNESREGLWKIYHENGKLYKEQTWKDDEPISEKCWDKNGNKIICE